VERVLGVPSCRTGGFIRLSNGVAERPGNPIDGGTVDDSREFGRALHVSLLDALRADQQTAIRCSVELR
jgi:hypothetical protein